MNKTTMVQLTVRFLLWIKQLQADPNSWEKLYPIPVQESPPKLFKTDEPAYQDVHALRPPPQSIQAQQCFVFLRRKETDNFFDEIPSTRRLDSNFSDTTTRIKRCSQPEDHSRRPSLEKYHGDLSLDNLARMEIPQDRKNISRHSPTEKSPNIQSNDKTLTHKTGTLPHRPTAICIIDNTSPIEQNSPSLRDLDNERSHDKDAAGGPVAAVKAGHSDQKLFAQMIQATFEAGAKVVDTCENFAQRGKRKKRK